MEAALKVLNEMESAGVIERYAIGGAVAAMLYTEPFNTSDLDIFVCVREDAHPLNPLEAAHDFLRSRGTVEGEYVWVEGIKLQFLIGTRLEEEAIENAREYTYVETPTRFFTAEYLVAAALRAGRSKDYARVELLLREAQPLDRTLVMQLVDKFSLRTAWEKFLVRYPEFSETP